MDQGSATVFQSLMQLLATIISALIVSRATIYAAKLRETHKDNVWPEEAYGKEDHGVRDQVAKQHNEPSISLHVVALVIAGLAVVAVFVYIPFVSDYAFWFMTAAFIIIAGGFRPRSK